MPPENMSLPGGSKCVRCDTRVGAPFSRSTGYLCDKCYALKVSEVDHERSRVITQQGKLTAFLLWFASLIAIASASFIIYLPFMGTEYSSTVEFIIAIADAIAMFILTLWLIRELRSTGGNHE